MKWVKAHFDYVGNEFADMQAKQGTTNNENRVFIPPPLSWAKHKVKLGIDEIWTERFQKSPGLRQTKFWLSRNEKKVTNYLINLSRKDLGLMTQLITGHCRLNRHESLINKDVNPICRKCEKKDSEETPIHLIVHCPKLMKKRKECFGEHFGDKHSKWTVYQLFNFMRKMNFEKLNKRD